MDVSVVIEFCRLQTGSTLLEGWAEFAVSKFFTRLSVHEFFDVCWPVPAMFSRIEVSACTFFIL